MAISAGIILFLTVNTTVGRVFLNFFAVRECRVRVKVRVRERGDSPQRPQRALRGKSGGEGTLTQRHNVQKR